MSQKSKVKASVRGPQLALKVNGRSIRGVRGKRAAGEPERHARVRYVEPPHKVTGNPFIAFRAPRALRAAFKRWCKDKKVTMPDAFREYMSKVTGVAVEGDNNE